MSAFLGAPYKDPPNAKVPPKRTVFSPRKQHKPLATTIPDDERGK